MSFAETIGRMMGAAPAAVSPPPLRVRSDLPQSEFPPMDVLMGRVWRGQTPGRQYGWYDALGVPAIYRAVTLIANTVGALSLDGIRDGATMKPQDRPRIIVRPNPFTTPREFLRETAYSMATQGEAWWWTAARGGDGEPLSVIPMPAQEVRVEENPADLLRPIITWKDRPIKNADATQIVLSREPGSLRGTGPLQKCGAAVSVAVAAQDWAVNFFAGGGVPSVVIKSATELGSAEAAMALKRQWIETPSNMPHVIDPGIDSVDDFGFDPEKAQLMEARRYSNGEAALMFGIPASLMDHTEPGASLTYQNVSQEYDKFLKACLWPNYLEPIEQAMSDLLTRSTVARFNTDGLLRADIKTRFDVYNIGVPLGVLTTEEARQQEGLEPGDVETAPVPQALPQAVPSSLPIQVRTEAFRCTGYRLRLRYGTQHREPCNRLLSDTGTFVGMCPRCKKVYGAVPA